MKMAKLPSAIMLWWLGFWLAIVGLELAWVNGILELIYTNDGTKLSLAIGIILVWQSIACGIEMRKSPRWFDHNAVLERGWFFSDVVLSLGMIGTVLGFMVMLSGFKDLDIADVQTAQDMITQLGSGMAMALITTAVGLISSVLLKLQFFMLQNHLRPPE